jgi:hypothetical protein
MDFDENMFSVEVHFIWMSELPVAGLGKTKSIPAGSRSKKGELKMKACFQIFETPFLLCRMAGASLQGSAKPIPAGSHTNTYQKSGRSMSETTANFSYPSMQGITSHTSSCR